MHLSFRLPSRKPATPKPFWTAVVRTIVDEKKGGPRAPQAQGPPFRSEGDYLKTPNSKARMSTVAARSRATSSPGASSLPASVS